METRFLLDTNILSDLIRHPHGPVAQRLAEVPGALVCTSIVVACELRYGAAKRAATALTQRVEALLDCIPVLPLDAEADRHYAEIRTVLERAGQCIGGNDHDRDYCIESAITNGKVALDYGCSEAYNSFINCISTTSVCKNLPITNTPYLDGSNCSQNSDALSSCEKAASTRGDRHFLTVP